VARLLEKVSRASREYGALIRHSTARASVLGVLAVSLTACGTLTAAGSTTTPTSPPAPSASGSVVTANGPGWTASGGLEGPIYAPGACHAGASVLRGQSQPLPDPHCTPGAVDPTVTQANVGQTICRPGGYTSTVRPPERLTAPEKRVLMRDYGVVGFSSGYELDHLVPLELGGASDTRNLWPEQDVGGTSAYVHNAKDQVEADLHAAVCSGQIRLATAQQTIASNWTTAKQALGVAFGPGAIG